MSGRTLALAVLSSLVALSLLAALSSHAAPTSLAAPTSHAESRTQDEPVVVIVDMDPAAPGFQNEVMVPPGETRVEGIAVHIFDPLASRPVRAIGYVGGIDRGIAFGHVPGNGTRGSVDRLEPHAGTPVNPGNFVVLVTEPGLDHAFSGPEVQYVEAGAAGPSIIGPPPGEPVITVDVTLSGTESGDLFDFYLVDFVAIWQGSNELGAFSTREPLSLDTGGDAVPDSTHCLYGVDPDSAVAVPPAAYLVDLIDGGPSPGPARIVVRPPVSIDSSGAGHASGLRLTCPSPFRRFASIRYALPARSPVRLAVYDVGGRLVRLIERSPSREAGQHIARWDGQDDRGRALPCGVYVLRLEAARDERAERLVLIR